MTMRQDQGVKFVEIPLIPQFSFQDEVGGLSEK